jgi:uncharacterized alpha-E superfamily protein
MERAEDTARILDVTYHTLLEQAEHPYRLRWDPLIAMAGEEQLFRNLYGDADGQNVFEFLAFNPRNPGSIVQCINKARENARTIRDRISREMWEDINGLYFSTSAFNAAEEMAAGPHRFCERIKLGSHRFHGITDATLPHDESWQFLRIGCSLERAEMTARLVDVQYHSLLEVPPDAPASDHRQWMAVLKSVGAYEAYRRQYHVLEPERVAEMLILHPQHPRSIRFSMQEIHSGLLAVSGSANDGSYANEAERLAGRILERLRYDRVDEIFKRGLHTYLQDLLNMCYSVGEGISRAYFHYAVAV